MSIKIEFLKYNFLNAQQTFAFSKYGITRKMFTPVKQEHSYFIYFKRENEVLLR
jgi:hypothetical protein